MLHAEISGELRHDRRAELGVDRLRHLHPDGTDEIFVVALRRQDQLPEVVRVDVPVQRGALPVDILINRSAGSLDRLDAVRLVRGRGVVDELDVVGLYLRRLDLDVITKRPDVVGAAGVEDLLQDRSRRDLAAV